MSPIGDIWGDEMRMMKMMVAGLALACSGSATAGTLLLSGTITAQKPYRWIEGPAPYANIIHPLFGRFRVAFSHPVTADFLGIGQVYMDYYDENGILYNQDNGDVASGGSFNHQKMKVFTITTKGEFQDPVAGGWAEGGAYPFFYEFTMHELERPVDFTITSLKAGAVPEPATWALMIMGIGATGAALRRRKTTAIAAAT